jgi:AcrR family transcriptional regulator
VSSKERRERERVDTRHKILDAAREMFVRKGYEATTMRAIADRIDYTPTAIYHHFPSKEALLTELTTQDFRALAQAFRETAQVTDPVERLRQIGRAYIEFGVTHPMHYQLMFMTPPHPDGTKSRIKHGDPGEDAYAFLVQACERAIAASRFRPELKDPHQVAQILWSGCHGLVSLWIARRRDAWVEWRDIRTTAAELHNVMLHGLLQSGNT